MDFDEYDYLEKAVENHDDRELKKPKKDDSDRYEKSSRKREVDEEAASGERDDEEVRVKRSRSDHENGKEDRDRSDRGRDRHRKDREEEADVGKERDRERNRARERGSSEKERERDRDKDRDREKERDKERHKDRKERERDKDRRDKERDREREREKEREKERREKERREREREKEKEREEERSRRSRSRSVREREREIDVRESRRMKEKKDVEPEADPERDQRTVFAYQMPLKATERDVYEFFSKAGKVRDVRLIMDRNSRRSKGVGYVEFYDAMSVPMAIALSGQLLLGQPVMVKPSEAEKNLVQSNTSGGASGAGPYGAVDRKLYVGNLHFNMTETHLREIFEAFGPVELVQLPLDLESGHCKGFGFVQFAHLEHAKAAQSLNGKLEIAGRTIKVSSVTDHIGTQENVAKSNDLDDDEGGGLALNAQSRALLMQKLDRTGIATSIAGSLGAPVLNGSAPSQRSSSLPINGQAAVPAVVLPANFTPPSVLQSVGSPSECLLLKNMFDPSTETEPDFDMEIKEDVEEECSKYGRVKHIYVDKNSAGCVYLQYETMEAAVNAQRAMHLRWFAGRQISVLFMQPQVYEAKFTGA